MEFNIWRFDCTYIHTHICAYTHAHILYFREKVHLAKELKQGKRDKKMLGYQKLSFVKKWT